MQLSRLFFDLMSDEPSFIHSASFVLKNVLWMLLDGRSSVDLEFSSPVSLRKYVN